MTDIEIEFESESQHAVRLKFLLGEWVLAIWSPVLLVLDPVRFDEPGWPLEPLKLLDRINGRGDGLFCRKVPADKFEPGVGRYGPFLSYVRNRDVLYCVKLDGTFEGFLKAMSSKSRQNLMRSVRRFADRQGGRPSWEVFTEPDQMATFHAQAVAISRQTYQSRLLGSGLPDGQGFVDEMQQLAGTGRARGYILRDSGAPVAFAWCYQQGSRLVYSNVGYLPEFADHSPGTVLLYYIVMDVFAMSRYSLLDFGPGQAQYKSFFGNWRREFVDLFLLRSTFRNWLLLQCHWHLSSAMGDLGQWLERHGYKKQVKSLMRRLRGLSV